MSGRGESARGSTCRCCVTHKGISPATERRLVVGAILRKSGVARCYDDGVIFRPSASRCEISFELVRDDCATSPDVQIDIIAKHSKGLGKRTTRALYIKGVFRWYADLAPAGFKHQLKFVMGAHPRAAHTNLVTMTPVDW